ncbi:hypothetical protein AAFF_G00296830 [Aldrovandia affinis]|uniref:Uncharacterized protein n=1 Tax=Aldrovandia affinis TaxID=143900 RepID=A0AAD7WRN9_9TELE|nr:hypothetical protein AAFF_G00296830 [Aldrovandia affinis]
METPPTSFLNERSGWSRTRSQREKIDRRRNGGRAELALQQGRGRDTPRPISSQTNGGECGGGGKAPRGGLMTRSAVSLPVPAPRARPPDCDDEMEQFHRAEHFHAEECGGKGRAPRIVALFRQTEGGGGGGGRGRGGGGRRRRLVSAGDAERETEGCAPRRR